MKNTESPPQLNRRSFLANTATATVAGAITVLKPSLVFGAEANSAVNLGLIGCGGRGVWIAKLFKELPQYRFTAVTDYFQDRIDAAGDELKVERDHRYAGLAGYKHLLESEVDAVVIETPPYFHPEHAMAAVDAGKHVFIAKPIAVDVPGCLTIADAGKKATAKKQVFLVDFQTRANELYRQAVGKVHQGAIGPLVLAEAHYPWRGGGRGLPPATIEEQLRNWYYVLPLSGDFIVEQSIHSLDVATWIINADPIRAIGAGGRKVRPPGSIYDHFAINYSFPNDLVLSFTCIQAIPEVKDEITCRVFGAEGYIDTDYFSNVWLRGKDEYEGGSVGNLYTTGAQVNIKEFHQFITQGNYANPTVAPSVRSNLTAILGREAGYRGGELTWANLLKENKKLELNLKGLKS